MKEHAKVAPSAPPATTASASGKHPIQLRPRQPLQPMSVEHKCRISDLKDCSKDQLASEPYRIALGIKGLYWGEQADVRLAYQRMRRLHPNGEGAAWDQERRILDSQRISLWAIYQDRFLSSAQKLRAELSETAPELQSHTLDEWYSDPPQFPSQFPPAILIDKLEDVADELIAMAGMLDSKTSIPPDHVEILNGLVKDALPTSKCDSAWYSDWEAKVSAELPFIKVPSTSSTSVNVDGCRTLEDTISRLDYMIVDATRLR